MTKSYVCETCGAMTSQKGHLCAPQPIKGKCDRCGAAAESARHICKPMREKLEYFCKSCGRPAEEPDLLCQPKAIPGPIAPGDMT